MKCTKIFLMFILTFLILPLVLSRKSYAYTTYFSDNFKSGNLNKWTQNIGNVGDTSSWFILDGYLHGKVDIHEYSYLYANVVNLPQNFVLSADVKNISSVDQQFVLRVSEDKSEYYLVDYRYNDSIWYWDNNNIKVYRIYKDHYITLGTYPSDSIPRTFDVTQGINHKIQIKINDNNIKVYFDDVLSVDATDSDSNPLNGTGVGLMTWGGDIPKIDENIFSNILISDEIKVGRNKIIVIPGLGASWNPQAILLGDTSPSNMWTMTPFVKNYDSLIRALEVNGLVKNQDFYVWNYDWRKPLSQIVIDFNNFINSLNLQNGEKIDLVGHSLGGLLARVWTQDHPDLVDKTITLGSPQFGSVKAYEAWNGAKVGNDFDFSTIALNVLLQLEKKNNNTLVETLRSFAPIVYDLSPSFDFLKKNGKIVTTSSSQYLKDKNNTVSSVKDKLITVDGLGVNTKEWINLGEQNIVDKILGQWVEGRPISYLYGAGDGTVLKKSALIDGAENDDFNSDHGNLVNKSVNFVLDKLGLETTVAVVVNNLPKKEAIFYLGSPATMTVNCGGTERSDIDGWVLMENQESQNCKVTLIGKDGGGVYHLAIGDNKGWTYVEDEIKDGEKQTIKIKGDDLYWKILRWDFRKLGIKDNGCFDKKDIYKTIDAYFDYRKKQNRYLYSEEILANLKLLLKNKSFSYKDFNLLNTKFVSSRISILAKGKKINYSEAFNYNQAEKLGSDNDYASIYLANKLFGLLDNK